MIHSEALRVAVLAALETAETPAPREVLAARVHAGWTPALAELDGHTLTAVLAAAAARQFTWDQRERRASLGRPPESVRAWLAQHAPADERLLRRWAGIPWDFSEHLSPLERVQALAIDAVPPDSADVDRIPAGSTRDAATALWAERGVLDDSAVDRIDGIGEPVEQLIARGALLSRGRRVPSARLADWAARAARLNSARPVIDVARVAVLAAARVPEADAAVDRLLRTALTADSGEQTRVVEGLASAMVGLGLSVPLERLAKSLLLRPPLATTQLARVVAFSRALARSRGGLAEAGYAALRQVLPHVRTRTGHAVIHAAGLMALSRTPGRSLDVVRAELLSALGAADREAAGSAEAVAARAVALEFVAEASPGVALLALEHSAARALVARVMAPWVWASAEA